MSKTAEIFLCRLLSNKQVNQLKSNPELYDYTLQKLDEYLKQRFIPAVFKLFKMVTVEEQRILKDAIHAYLRKYPQDKTDFVSLDKTFKPDARNLLSSFLKSLVKKICGDGPKVKLDEVQLYLDNWDQYNKFLKYADRFESILAAKKRALQKVVASKLSALLKLLLEIVRGIVRQFVAKKKAEVST